MTSGRRTRVPFLLGAAAVLALSACSGSAIDPSPGTSPDVIPADAVTITVSPPTASLSPTARQPFTASDSDPTDSVAWSIEEGASGGAVTSAGVYTAPSTTGTYHVVATSHKHPNKKATATVTVTPSPPPVVAVQVSPTSAPLAPGASTDFTATVTGSTNQNVTWTVQEGAAGGGISSAGHYTAPQTAGTYHVVATAVVDTSKSATATVTVATPPPPPSSGWLQVQGNHITLDGKNWHGRGANLPDTRSCNACSYQSPSVDEVKRRIDLLVDVWKANFIRLDLESYASADGRVQWAGVLDDSGYLADVQTIVSYIASKPGVYVLVALWVDPTFTSMGWPTAATDSIWTKLADVFKYQPRVLFGLCNEPQMNYDGAYDSQVWTAMNDAVAAIRTVEDAAGTPHHVITAQGTGGWARRLDYYVTHPITAGAGDNVAYEVHVYDSQTDFPSLFENPAKTLPVVIGEFGPFSGMTNADIMAMMDAAQALEIPYLAWTFHMRCDPSLLVDNSGGGCGVGMTLAPTSWGSLVMARLAQPW